MMKIFIFCLAAFLMLCSPALATEPYCSINGTSSGCAISVNGDVVRVLTCAHGKKLREQVKVRFRRTLDWREGRVTALDSVRDLALVETSAGHRQQFIDLADETPDDGTVTIYGYGHKAFVEHRTRIIGRDGRFHRVDGTVRSGDSGSAVLSKGRLVGVTFGYLKVGHDGLFVPVDEVNRFLENQW